ncbi:MAG: CAP domain-containing protein [bacterium]
MKIKLFYLCCLLLSFSLPILSYANSGQSATPIMKPNSQAADQTSDEQEPKTYQGLTAAHNRIRQPLGLPALVWSNHLAAHAQEWADYLADKQQCAMEHRPNEGQYQRIYGENLFWASPRRWSNGFIEAQPINAADIVTPWADEKHDYDYDSNQCASGKVCGHYTQIIWRDTERVGCGMRICDNKAQIWVCSYDPAGNYTGEKPY